MGDRNKTLATYISDMHALEQHFMEPFERQLDLTKDMPDAHRVVQQIVNSARTRMEACASRLQQVSGDAPSKGVSDAVKTAVSGFMGLGAAAVDTVRPQRTSKALRDSYTALNHAIIGYIMLQTTAVALNDPETANLAVSNLQSCVRDVQSIASIMPQLVIHDVQDDVGTVDTTAATQVTSNQSLRHLFGEGQARAI